MPRSVGMHFTVTTSSTFLRGSGTGRWSTWATDSGAQSPPQCHHLPVNTLGSDAPERPWSARRPQSLVLSAVLILLAAVLVWQALSYIGEGVGGLVPYLMLFAGPALAVYYTWYFNFMKFDEAAD